MSRHQQAEGWRLLRLLLVRRQALSADSGRPAASRLIFKLDHYPSDGRFDINAIV
jgi:hypothetical protein